MSFSSPLDSRWEAYQVTRDCLKVAQRAVENQSLLLLTRFVGLPQPNAIELIKKSRDEADDFVILSLWAAFERITINFLQEKGKKVLEEFPQSFSEKFYEKLEKEVEYWKINDVLDLFRGSIDSNLIGDAKHIKKYRDWLAHRNEKRGTPPKVYPIFTYEILSEIIIQIQNLTPQTKIS